MNKRELIDILNKKLNISKSKCKMILEEIIIVVKDCLNKGEKVKINSFGAFSTKELKSKKVYNPIRREYIMVKKKIVPIFKPSKEFYIDLL